MNHHHRHTNAWEKHKREINENLSINKHNFQKDYKYIKLFYYILIFYIALSLFLPPVLPGYQLTTLFIFTLIYFFLWLRSDHVFSRHDKNIDPVDYSDNLKWFIPLKYISRITRYGHTANFTKNTFLFLLIFLTVIKLIRPLLFS